MPFDIGAVQRPNKAAGAAQPRPLSTPQSVSIPLGFYLYRTDLPLAWSTDTPKASGYLKLTAELGANFFTAEYEYRSRIRVSSDSAGRISVRGWGASDALMFSLSSGSTNLEGSELEVFWAWDGDTGTGEMYVNGVSDLAGWSTINTGNLATSEVTHCALFERPLLHPSGTGEYEGDFTRSTVWRDVALDVSNAGVRASMADHTLAASLGTSLFDLYGSAEDFNQGVLQTSDAMHWGKFGPSISLGGVVSADGASAGLAMASGASKVVVQAIGAVSGGGVAIGVSSSGAVISSIGSANGSALVSGAGHAIATAFGTITGTNTAVGIGKAHASADGAANGSAALSGIGQAISSSTGSAFGSSGATASSSSGTTVTGLGSSSGQGEVSGAGRANVLGRASVLGATVITGVGASVSLALGSAPALSLVLGQGMSRAAALGLAQSSSIVFGKSIIQGGSVRRVATPSNSRNRGRISRRQNSGRHVAIG